MLMISALVGVLSFSKQSPSFTSLLVEPNTSQHIITGVLGIWQYSPNSLNVMCAIRRWRERWQTRSGPGETSEQAFILTLHI